MAAQDARPVPPRHPGQQVPLSEARSPSSAIGATFSSSGGRCPTCNAPASTASSVAGSRCTGVSDRSSSASAATAEIDSATTSSWVAHSLTGRSTCARAAHRSAHIAPGAPCGRSAVAGRVAANSATARARTALCRATSRSAACAAPSGPDDSPTGGASTGPVSTSSMSLNLDGTTDRNGP